MPSTFSVTARTVRYLNGNSIEEPDGLRQYRYQKQTKQMALSAGWEDISRVLLKTKMNWNAKGTNQDKPLAV